MVAYCGIWECCGYDKATAETRDIIEELLHQSPPKAARELRSLVLDADRNLAGDALVAGWWRVPLVWRD
ncbi:hypothetical protein [Occultella kanbiaonis]|uniref:hypothetical protein n=1 Tax=Occultella kanbiaonis TaxID=2675754 RepID=UPI0013D7523F|nr:hypothetical protein [Occultella kanbiaonis]